MAKRFQYTVNYKAFGVADEKCVSELPEKTKIYFRKLTRCNPSADRLRSKALKLLGKAHRVYADWFNDQNNEELCNAFIREFVDFLNRLIFYRFKNDARDFAPREVVGLLLKVQSFIDFNRNVNGYILKVRHLFIALLYHLLEESEPGVGIYVCGVEL